MKLTDKKIIEALKAGKEIKNSVGDVYRMVGEGVIINKNTCGQLVSSIANLTDDFEIVETEIDLDKVAKEGYLCRVLDTGEEPSAPDIANLLIALIMGVFGTIMVAFSATAALYYLLNFKL